MGIFCLIKDGKIKNAIVATQEIAEKIKTDQNFDSIKERKEGEKYSNGFVFDNEIEKDFIHAQIIIDREKEAEIT